MVWAQFDIGEMPVSLPDPGAEASLVRTIGNAVRFFRSRYPNLRLVFLTSDVYEGHNTNEDREPYTYELGFAMKWLIQAQIDQMASRGTIVDERAGDLNYNTVVPWIVWGPYLWADGVNPRSDGLFWSVADFGGGFFQGRLSDEGREKAASLLLTFFKTSPQTRCWFLAGETC